MTTDIPAGQGIWTDNPLYLFLMQVFPLHRTKRNVLDVRGLSGDLDKSHERVYQWLRDQKLSSKNAKGLLALANSEPNASALRERGITPPEIRDFDRYVYAD